MNEFPFPYPPTFFEREDPSDDRRFYANPRLVVHVDDQAVTTITKYLKSALPKDGTILDLMSSWRSHLPEDVPFKKVTGLGLNAEELQQNPQLHERLVHDLNASPFLPLRDKSFDAAVLTVSIQYMVHPAEVFGEVLRVLKPGGSFHVLYSNRMFPTKAVSIWRSSSEEQWALLVSSYFRHSGPWQRVEPLDLSPRPRSYSDPVYVVRAVK